LVVLELEELSITINEFEENKLINNNNLLFDCLKNNEIIDETLHVITVISNVCEFKRRWELMEQFIKRIDNVPNVKLYVVELAYENQEFHITSPSNPQHLQLRTKYALWHKENMINLGIRKLLPQDWKAVAWIDGDIEFENPNWALDTLKVLTKFDIVQLFTTCFDLDEKELPMSIWQSYGYKYCHGKIFKHEKGLNYWHCGYAWACTRNYWNSIGGLYDKSILGSGDYILTQSIFKKCANVTKNLLEFKNEIKNFYTFNFINNIKVGYIPTNINHYFHGSKINRKYIERNDILIKYNYSPLIHITYDENGVIIPSNQMSIDFINDINQYFKQRNEDEYYDIIKTNK